MKKLCIGLFVVGVSTLINSASALSCAEFPEFGEMYEDAEVAFRGTLSFKEQIINPNDDAYCQEQGQYEEVAGQLGVHLFTFAVQEGLKGEVESSITVSRQVTGINCTRGGACVDMKEGKEYVVLANSDLEMGGGLCSPCPYIAAEEFVAPEEKVCICTMEYNPMCGVDGKTYGNPCALACDDTPLAYTGECNQQVPQENIPNTCVSWYDGCNTCSVENGLLGACTKMACVRMDTPRCLKNEFMYLNTKYQYVINSFVTQVFKDMDPELKQQKATKILQNIENKRNEIMDVLMRSTFVVGSPELKRYSLLLEVLTHLESVLK